MHGCLFGLTRQTFSTFRALKIILIENAIKIHLYLFFVGSELVLDVSDPMPARTLLYHYQVGHCREPTRTLFVAGSELVRVRVDPEPLKLQHNTNRFLGCIFQSNQIIFKEHLSHRGEGGLLSQKQVKL